jgi:hypothetical protein
MKACGRSPRAATAGAGDEARSGQRRDLALESVLLPDGRDFLFWVQAAKPSIRVGSIDSSATRYVFDSDSRAAYGSGFVLFSCAASSAAAI